MKKIKLSKRLALIAGFVSSGKGIVDVGTDHGYVPIYLAQNGYQGKIYASDIREGPLSHAKKFAMEYGVASSIEFVLSDGLKAFSNRDFDTIIIAGMGGETIIHILENAQWINNTFHLILQPQSKIADLSHWLYNNGFSIQDEALVKDAGRIYPVMYVQEKKSRAPFSDAEMYADRILLENHDPLLPEYLASLIKKLEHELQSKQKSKTANTEELDHLQFALSGFYKMLEETHQW